MKQIIADYLIPTENGDYEKVNFRTSADLVEETLDKNFIPRSLKEHLIDIKGKELLVSDLNDSPNDTSKRVASSKALKELAECLGGGTIQIVISPIEPPRKPGKNIIWIKEEDFSE